MNHARNKGFTIVELTVSMAFISALLLAIALTILQIIGIYNRGLTLKEVNQAGRTISTNLQESISVSMPFGTSGASAGADSSHLTQTWGGALCVGGYSYVWNNGKAIRDAISNNNYTSINKYLNVTNYGTTPAKLIPHFVKIYDPARTSCSGAADAAISVDRSQSTELLAVGQMELVVHSLDIAYNGPKSSLTNQQLYDINLRIGTNEKAALVFEGGGSDGVASSCKTPNIITANPTYCSVQYFNFVARSGISN